MLLDRAAESLLDQQWAELGGEERGVNPLDQLCEDGVAGRANESLVKLLVGLMEALLGVRCAALGLLLHELLGVVECGFVAVRGAFGGKACRWQLKHPAAFEVRADEVESAGRSQCCGENVGVEDVPAVLRQHNRALAVFDVDEAAFLEGTDCLPGGAAAHLERLREIGLLRQHLSGLPIAGNDLADDRLEQVAMQARHDQLIKPHSTGIRPSRACQDLCPTSSDCR